MKRLIVVGVVTVTIAAVGQAWPALSVSRLSRPQKDATPFHYHASGSMARAAVEWRIAPGSSVAGLIVGAASCGDEIFLLDRQAGRVHHVDLTRQHIDGSIGLGAGALRFATSVAADCVERQLYVTHYDGVAVFDIDSGELAANHRRPSTFVHTLGASVLDSRSQTLAVPGLWPQADSDWLIKPLDRMFEGDRIGYQLDLRTGRTSPLVPAVERGCWSLGPNCTAATLDALDGGGWLAAHRVGMLVGVFDDRFQLVRTIDVRSPLFHETGRRNVSQKFSAMRVWGEENSVIRQVYAFGANIVTIHSVNRTSGRDDKATTFDVFMNVHTREGVRLLSDARLPDLPVGRDESSLYIVDYGPKGRRKLGRDGFALVRIPVEQ